MSSPYTAYKHMESLGVIYVEFINPLTNTDNYAVQEDVWKSGL